MTTQDARPVLRPRGNRPIPYTLTPAAVAALATDPAGDIRHEPRGPRRCSGRGCRCTFPGPRGAAR